MNDDTTSTNQQTNDSDANQVPNDFQDDLLEDQNQSEKEELNETSSQTTQDPKDEEIIKLKKDLEDMSNTAKRAMADYQNLKRVTEEEKREFAIYANGKLILEILPPLDNLQRAFEHVPDTLLENDFVKGIIQIEKQFMDILTKQGLENVKTIGEKLNPNLHEALLQGAGEKDIIIQEFEKGYTLNGKVIRHAKVMVGNGDEEVLSN